MDYFAPLSSYKEKHKQMKETLDFIKIKRYSVINLNNMFPVQSKDYTYLDFSKEQDLKYKSLLESEYRYININVNLKMYSFDHLRMYNIDHINTCCSRW